MPGFSDLSGKLLAASPAFAGEAVSTFLKPAGKKKSLE
jgi:hypothetical protein